MQIKAFVYIKEFYKNNKLILSSAVKRLMASKINVFVYIISKCVLYIFIAYIYKYKQKRTRCVTIIHVDASSFNVSKPNEIITFISLKNHFYCSDDHFMGKCLHVLPPVRTQIFKQLKH